MKKVGILIGMIIMVFSLAGCEIIENEIERAESIKLEDFTVDIPKRNILLKITSNADEQVIEEVIINDDRYELLSQGNDWYLLEDVPIAKNYDIGNVYYLTGVGATVSFDVDYEITLNEAINRLPEDNVYIVEDTLQVDDYTFNLSDETLIEITSENTYTTEEIDDWVWLILEDNLPIYAVFEHEEIIYVIDAPEETEDYLE